jgi:hypothetical protein
LPEIDSPLGEQKDRRFSTEFRIFCVFRGYLRLHDPGSERLLPDRLGVLSLPNGQAGSLRQSAALTVAGIPGA